MIADIDRCGLVQFRVEQGGTASCRKCVLTAATAQEADVVTAIHRADAEIALARLALALACRIDTGSSGQVGSVHEGLLGRSIDGLEHFIRPDISCQPQCDYPRTRPYIRTPLIAQTLSAHPAMEEQIISRHPVGRMGRPEEIAEAVVWLCSDAASFVTDHTMTVDGGYVAQ